MSAGGAAGSGTTGGPAAGSMADEGAVVGAPPSTTAPGSATTAGTPQQAEEWRLEQEMEATYEYHSLHSQSR